MFDRVKSLPSPNGVGASQDFTINVPVGVEVLEDIGLEMGGGTFVKTDVTNLELSLDGKPVHRYKTVAHLEAIRAYYKLAVNSNRIVVPIRPHWLLEASQADLLSVGLANISTCQLKGSIGGSAVAPTLAAWARKKTLPTRANNDLGVFIERRYFEYGVTGSGVKEIADLPRSESIAAIHIVNGGNVTGCIAEVDGINVWDTPASNGGVARMQEIVEMSGRRVAQTNVVHLDFMLSDSFGGQLPVQGAKDFRLKVDHSGNDTLGVYVEYLNGL